MNSRSSLLRLGRVAHDASFVVLDQSTPGEKLRALCQLVRIALAPTALRGRAPTVGRRGFRVRYLDSSSLWQAYHEIFMRQVYSFRSNKEAPVIFDCGANIGMATLYFKTNFPRSRIEAFEPDPLAFKTLEENVAQNGLEEVSLHQCALWDSEGELDFYVDKVAPGALVMSILPERLGSHGGRIRVPAERLSRFIGGEGVDFLKVDVEGAEEALLTDLAREGSLRKVKQIAVEYHHPLGGEVSHLGRVLGVLEAEGFDSEISADLRPPAMRDPLHDVMIYARRRA